MIYDVSSNLIYRENLATEILYIFFHFNLKFSQNFNSHIGMSFDIQNCAFVPTYVILSDIIEII